MSSSWSYLKSFPLSTVPLIITHLKHFDLCCCLIVPMRCLFMTNLIVLLTVPSLLLPFFPCGFPLQRLPTDALVSISHQRDSREAPLMSSLWFRKIVCPAMQFHKLLCDILFMFLSRFLNIFPEMPRSSSCGALLMVFSTMTFYRLAPDALPPSKPIWRFDLSPSFSPFSHFLTDDLT